MELISYPTSHWDLSTYPSPMIGMAPGGHHRPHRYILTCNSFHLNKTYTCVHATLNPFFRERLVPAPGFSPLHWGHPDQILSLTQKSSQKGGIHRPLHRCTKHVEQGTGSVASPFPLLQKRPLSLQCIHFMMFQGKWTLKQMNWNRGSQGRWLSWMGLFLATI